MCETIEQRLLNQLTIIDEKRQVLDTFVNGLSEVRLPLDSLPCPSQLRFDVCMGVLTHEGGSVASEFV